MFYDEKYIQDLQKAGVIKKNKVSLLTRLNVKKFFPIKNSNKANVQKKEEKELVNIKPKIYTHLIFLESLLGIVPLNIIRCIYFQLNMVY